MNARQKKKEKSLNVAPSYAKNTKYLQLIKFLIKGNYNFLFISLLFIFDQKQQQFQI